jgi:hypothetical protein
MVEPTREGSVEVGLGTDVGTVVKLFDVARHGHVNVALFVIPSKGETAVTGTGPICRYRVKLLETV